MRTQGLWCAHCHVPITLRQSWSPTTQVVDAVITKQNTKQSIVLCLDCFHLNNGVKDGAPLLVRAVRWWRVRRSLARA